MGGEDGGEGGGGSVGKRALEEGKNGSTGAREGKIKGTKTVG